MVLLLVLVGMAISFAQAPQFLVHARSGFENSGWNGVYVKDLDFRGFRRRRTLTVIGAV
jgi:hypothetical protein